MRTMVKGLGINALDETCLLNLQPCKFILSGALRRLFSHIGRSNLSREGLLPLQTGRQSTPIEGPNRVGHGLSQKSFNDRLGLNITSTYQPINTVDLLISASNKRSRPII